LTTRQPRRRIGRGRPRPCQMFAGRQLLRYFQIVIVASSQSSTLCCAQAAHTACCCPR
jgi:hypothetical protein